MGEVDILTFVSVPFSQNFCYYFLYFYGLRVHEKIG